MDEFCQPRSELYTEKSVPTDAHKERILEAMGKLAEWKGKLTKQPQKIPDPSPLERNYVWQLKTVPWLGTVAIKHLHK